MRRSQFLASALTIGWLALQWAIFIVVRPELAYSYGHWLSKFAGNLPLLTESFSLPVLGPAISTASHSHSLLFWMVWGAVFVPPLLFLRGIWLCRERTELLEYVLYRISFYLLALAAIGIFLVLGLWLPYSAA